METIANEQKLEYNGDEDQVALEALVDLLIERADGHTFIALNAIRSRVIHGN
jgi:hypothetical protein